SAVVNIREMNSVIAADTAPGVVALHGMTISVARLRSILFETLRMPTDIPALRLQVAEERSALAEHAWRWFALPITPGEAELMGAARTGMGRLDDVTQRVLEVTPATPPAAREALKGELEAVVNELDGIFLHASMLNAELANRASDVVDRVGGRLM